VPLAISAAARPEDWGVGPSGRGQFRASGHDGVLTAGAGGAHRAGTGPEKFRGYRIFRGDRTMRDPELVGRAQHAAARLESAWERWRALQGLGETPAQPVVGYVGYALSEPWGQPRAVIGFSADEAERLAEFLERDNTDHVLELAQRHVPDQPVTQLLAAASAAKDEVLAVTSQLSGSQQCHSFLQGSGARLKEQEPIRWPLSRSSGLGTARPRPESRLSVFCGPTETATADMAGAGEAAVAGETAGAPRDAWPMSAGRGRDSSAGAGPCSTCTETPRSEWCSGTPGNPW